MWGSNQTISQSLASPPKMSQCPVRADLHPERGVASKLEKIKQLELGFSSVACHLLDKVILSIVPSVFNPMKRKL